MNERSWKKVEDSTLWRPEPGDTVEGRLLAIREADSDFGEGKYKIFDLETKSGKIAVPGTVMLERLMESIPTGGEVKIKYTGTMKVPNGKMKTYEVSVPQ
jgi:hypothetical protein